MVEEARVWVSIGCTRTVLLDPHAGTRVEVKVLQITTAILRLTKALSVAVQISVPEESFWTVDWFILARASHSVEEIFVLANAHGWADAYALLHVEYMRLILARLRHAHASALVRIPVLVKVAKLWLRSTETLAILGAPVSLHSKIGS